MFRRALIASLILMTGATAQANLIMNGSFENIDQSQQVGHYGSDSTWRVYTRLPGWHANRNMEVWNSGFLGRDAVHGSRLIELNAHPKNGVRAAFEIWQVIATESGQMYELSFFARARNDLNETFAVTAGDVVETVTEHVKNSWTQVKVKFVGDDQRTRISFTSLDHWRDTTGNLIDDVRVRAVPEPGALFLIGFGLVALVGIRRHLGGIATEAENA